MADTATIQLPKDLIEAAIEKEVSLAMAKALGGHEQIIQTAITRVLAQKVDNNGNPSTYSSNPTFIKWAMDAAIRNAVSTALTTQIAKYQSEIEKHLATELSKKNSPLLKQLAISFSKSIIEVSENKYRLSVTVE